MKEEKGEQLFQSIMEEVILILCRGFTKRSQVIYAANLFVRMASLDFYKTLQFWAILRYEKQYDNFCSSILRQLFISFPYEIIKFLPTILLYGDFTDLRYCADLPTSFLLTDKISELTLAEQRNILLNGKTFGIIESYQQYQNSPREIRKSLGAVFTANAHHSLTNIVKSDIIKLCEKTILLKPYEKRQINYFTLDYGEIKKRMLSPIYNLENVINEVH